MLYEVHMVKNYPPTNLNRDDSGAPKTCLFGGVERGRISSQCLKHSWRTSQQFMNELGAENLGIRTRKLPQLVGDRLREMGVKEETIALVQSEISKFGQKSKNENKDSIGKVEKKKDSSSTKQIVFYAPEDIEAVAQIVKGILDDCEDNKAVKKLKAKELQDAVKEADFRSVTLDIALFGRMVTSDAFRDVKAAMQVAHAISTNKVVLESDYFTAMDDLLSGDTMDEAGSAMIGDIDYNSSCYYIYAALDTDILKENLKHSEVSDEFIKKGLTALFRAMLLSNPSGKQNSFAGHSMPSAVMIECKDIKVPISLANAFVKPVSPDREHDLIEKSIQKLAEETDHTDADFGIPVAQRLWFCSSKYAVEPTAEHTACKNVNELIETAVQAWK